MKKIAKMKVQLVLSVAQKHFETFGYEKAQIKDIANEAEMSVGTIYNLFGSKEELFLCFVENKIGTIMDNFYDELLNENEPIKRLQLHINAKIREVSKYKDLLSGKSIPYNMLSFRPISTDTDNPRYKIIKLLEKTFEEMAKSMQFVTDDYIQISYIFLGITDAYIERWLYENIDIFDKRDEILSVFLRSVRV